MRRQADGSWRLQVPIAQGRHYYQFLVDGEPVLDPHAMYLTLEEPHKKVSFIAVG
jgi:1,4-alpha-glucan branching enzyme